MEKLIRHERDQGKRCGMKLSDLTGEILFDLIRIYDDVSNSELARECLERRAPSREMEYVNEILGISNAVAWRFGSKFSGDTKFYIWKEGFQGNDRLIRFSFDPNSYVSDPEGVRTEESDCLTQSFRVAVIKYLLNQGLAIEL